MKKSRQQVFDEILEKDDDRRPLAKPLTGYSEDTMANLILATLLSHLGGFKALLVEARLKIGIEPTFGIKHLIKLPSPASVNNISLLNVPLYPKQLKVLNSMSDEILEYYHLPVEWFESIKFAVLTNIVYLPPKPTFVHFSQSGAPATYPPFFFTS